MGLLIANVVATLLRMALSIFLGLWAVRIVFSSLGHEGFGVYAAELAIVSFLLLPTNSLGSSFQRNLAYAIGADKRGYAKRLTRSFVTASLLAGVLSAVVIAISAQWIAPLIAAPEPHDSDVVATLRWIALTAGFTIAQGPFRSYLIATQSIVALSAYELVDALLALAAALALLPIAKPTVTLYAMFLCISSAVSTILLVSASFALFPATRPGRIRELGSTIRMAFWLMVGSSAWTMRTQGSQLVIHTLGGVVVSAAHSIALKLALYQNNLSMAIYRVVRPALVTASGRKQDGNVRQLTIGTSKLMSLATLLACVPLLVETPALLEAWLGEASAMAIVLVRITVLWFSCKDLTSGYVAAVHASGRVAKHEFVIPTLDALGLSAGALAVFFGAPLWSISAFILLTVVIQAIFRVYCFEEEAKIKPSEWLRLVLLPYIFVLSAAIVIAVFVSSVAVASPWRVAAVIIVNGISVILLSCKFGLNSTEQHVARRALSALLSKVINRT